MNGRLLLLAFLAGTGLAAEPIGEPAEVRHALRGGAVVNWTRLTVEAQHQHQGSGVAGRQQATEQLVRQRIGPVIQDGLPQVQATGARTIGEEQGLVDVSGGLAQAFDQNRTQLIRVARRGQLNEQSATQVSPHT